MGRQNIMAEHGFPAAGFINGKKKETPPSLKKSPSKVADTIPFSSIVVASNQVRY